MWLDVDLADPSMRARAIELASAHAPRTLRRYLALTDVQIAIDGNGAVDLSTGELRELLVRGTVHLSLPRDVPISSDVDEAAFRRWLLLDGIEAQIPPPRASVAPASPAERTVTPAEVVEDPSIPGLRLAAEFITPEEERTLLAAVESAPWLDDLKRRVQHYGWKYDYKARSIAASVRLGPLPAWAQATGEKLLHAGLIEELPDQVIVNEYVGRQGIAPHIDCVPCFRGAIATISLLESWEMNFYSPEGKKVPRLLPQRSAAVMSGAARMIWQHEIPGRKNESWGARGRRISLTFRKVNAPSDAEVDAGSASVAVRPAESANEEQGQSFVYRVASVESRTPRAKATILVGPPESSERLVAIAPHGVEYGGLEFVPESLKAAVKVLDGNELLGFSQFRGEQTVRSAGITRKSNGTLFAIAVDGSLAMRRRLTLDRRGEGVRVARGDIGIFSSLEQLLAMFRYARSLMLHAPKKVHRWSFRHELHGIQGRHLVDDPVEGRRAGAAWTMSRPSAEEIISIAGEVDLRAPAQTIGKLLDDVAIRLAALFDCERVVQRMHAGSSTVELLRPPLTEGEIAVSQENNDPTLIHIVYGMLDSAIDQARASRSADWWRDFADIQWHLVKGKLDELQSRILDGLGRYAADIRARGLQHVESLRTRIDEMHRELAEMEPINALPTDDATGRLVTRLRRIMELLLDIERLDSKRRF
jgi:alkylated DNA repair dioxygenase AlkB